MPAKKKSKLKQAKVKRAAAKKKTAKKAAKAQAPKKSSKKSSRKKAAQKTKSKARRRPGSVSAERELNQELRGRRLSTPLQADRSEDFQGLSRAEEADSESVDELVEEGNAFEAGAVAGVEEADNADEKEVHTHEVPEDDVPEEYLDQD
jgi:hypothetical protein